MPEPTYGSVTFAITDVQPPPLYGSITQNSAQIIPAPFGTMTFPATQVYAPPYGHVVKTADEIIPPPYGHVAKAADEIIPPPYGSVLMTDGIVVPPIPGVLASVFDTPFPETIVVSGVTNEQEFGEPTIIDGVVGDPNPIPRPEVADTSRRDLINENLLLIIPPLQDQPFDLDRLERMLRERSDQNFHRMGISKTNRNNISGEVVADYTRSNESMDPTLSPDSSIKIDPSSTDLRKMARDIAKKYGVDPDLFESLVEAESNFNPKARSHVGAQGLCQLMPATARSLGVTDPYNPYQNLDGGARYIAKQLKRFKSVELALAAYNAGPGNVNKYKGVPPFKETQNYIAKIKRKIEEKRRN